MSVVRALKNPLSGSKPRIHSFEAVWLNSCSRFKRCGIVTEPRRPPFRPHATLASMLPGERRIPSVSLALGRDALRAGHQPKAEKSLGLSIPNSMLLLADEVIE